MKSNKPRNSNRLANGAHVSACFLAHVNGVMAWRKRTEMASAAMAKSKAGGVWRKPSYNGASNDQAWPINGEKRKMKVTASNRNIVPSASLRLPHHTRCAKKKAIGNISQWRQHNGNRGNQLAAISSLAS